MAGLQGEEGLAVMRVDGARKQEALTVCSASVGPPPSPGLATVAPFSGGEMEAQKGSPCVLAVGPGWE